MMMKENLTSSINPAFDNQLAQGLDINLIREACRIEISCLRIQRNCVKSEIRFDTGESNVTKPKGMLVNEQDKRQSLNSPLVSDHIQKVLVIHDLIKYRAQH